MYKSTIPIGSKGNYEIQKFVVTEEQAEVSKLRAMLNSHRGGRDWVPAGNYTKLLNIKTNDIIMSDTIAEISDLIIFVNKVHHDDSVLINGLGLGVAVELVIQKAKHVTVIEKEQDIIDLVAPHLLRKYNNLEIICDDAFTYKPICKYEVIWHDIWLNVNGNKTEIRKLHRKYSKYCDWQRSWCQQF